ncbi:hypothetical protein LXT12_24765 [Pelomonas sp. P7]|uniref:Uncharacterized protein n=1 Tax=Pelomonas caseinilytica TaxID=2906763 RepID=A0ABS8XHY6_9BURK|nr:hypothetical protein [Pelomonas sp. P7]MCE4540461.1 hypothetical protein [Pelomonas sp. P7]
MALYASHARGTCGLDLATLGAISAPQPSLAPGQLFVATGTRPSPGPRRPRPGRSRPAPVQPTGSHP